jgi:large subunit ribosomal protein L4
MKLEVLDQKGKKLDEIELAKSVFGQEASEDLIIQYLHVYRTNQRQGNAETKTRGDVSGGGKKPWKQKGTGRARHGSTRSPIWVHGGIAHGPKSKDWHLKFPKNMKKKVMQSLLTMKYNKGDIKLIESIEFKEPSTKMMSDFISGLNLHGKTLLVLDKRDTNVIKSAANLKNLITSQVSNLNAYDMLDSDNIVMVKDCVAKLEDKYK